MLRVCAVIGCLLLACSGDKAASGDKAPASPVMAKERGSLLEELAWLPASTSSVARMKAGSIFILELLGDQMGGREADCWRQIEKGIEAGYMFEMAGQVKSLLGFQGSFDRETVERCAEVAFSVGDILRMKSLRDGDITRFETESAGTVIVWWRSDGWALVGTAEQFASVQNSKKTLASKHCLQGLLAIPSEEPVALYRCDSFFENIFGIPTKGWMMGMSIKPMVSLTGAITVQFSSPGEAAKAMEIMRTKAFLPIVPRFVVDFIVALPTTVHANQIRFDLHLTQADMEKIDMAELQKLTEEIDTE